MRAKFQPACDCEPIAPEPEVINHSADEVNTGSWDVEHVVRCRHCGARYNEQVQHQRTGGQAEDLRRLRDMLTGRT